MEEFTERMLGRIRKRQELLDSTSTSLNMAEPASSEVSKSMTPPSRRKRRECLANLASRVDLWLENDTKCSETAESTQNDNNSTVKNDVPNHYTKQKIVSKLSSDATASVEKTKEINKFKSTQIQTPKPQYQQLPKKLLLSNNEKPLQRQSSNLTSTLTVAQRRALFENNIQQQNKKPTTTTVTISLKKITPAKVENKIPVAEEVKMPPCSTPSDVFTPPPSRYATRSQAGPTNAITPLDDVIPQQQHTWTPPCIKNVMFKKQMVDEQQQILQDYDKSDIAVVSSNPINTNIVSPADRIAMSVGHVKYMPDSSSSGLYPDLSLIEDNSNKGEESTLSHLENQTSGYKRRSIGTPTTSSESVTDIVLDAEILVAKRSRCDEPKPDDSGTVLTESCSTTPITRENHYSPMMSDHAADNQLSQACNSFTYYHGSDNPNKMPDLVHQNSQDLIVKSPANELMQSDRLHLEDNYFDGKKNERSVEQSVKNQALVHTVSTYRKQQQQLRFGGTLSSKSKSMEKEGYLHSTLLKQQLDSFQDDNDDDNDDEEEDQMLQELETAAERARHLERIVVPEQERIIEQATQALNICDMYRQQRGSLKPAASSNFSAEHVHAERLLLIAGLRRTDAVREAQRLRIEQTLSPGGILGERFYNLKNNSKSKILVIESLRVPILSAMVSGGSNYKATKLSHNDGIENLTRWSGAYRYFVCAIRAAATAYRSPMTAATRPADAVEESVQRFSFDAGCRIDEEVGYGYVEFITKKQFKSSGRKCLMPSESEGAPIMIHGLDNDGWKITVELYGLSSLNTGDHDNHNNSGNTKDHDGHENSKSVLDKLWSTVTIPSKELKKQHTTTPATCIESPGGPMAVRNTVFRQLGYFVFSDGQVDRQQFTLNKIHQSVSSTSNSRAATHTAVEETVRLKMRILEDGEQYAYYNEGERDSLLGSNKYASSGNTVVRKPLTLPTECKRMEGFLTLFDDHELRTTPAIEQGTQWQRHTDIGGSANLGGTTLWRRLWFRVEIIDDPKYQETSKSDDDKQTQQNNIGLYKTIVLRYWMYPEHAEQQREPMGAINLGRCLPMSSHKTEITSIVQQKKHLPTPAAPALPDLCARPNTLRLLMYNIDSANNNDNYGGDNLGFVDGTDDPLLLAADTADERREWCETINASVRAIDEHNKQMETIEATRLKQEQQNQEKVHQERTGTWLSTPSDKTKSFGKKKKYYK